MTVKYVLYSMALYSSVHCSCTHVDTDMFTNFPIVGGCLYMCPPFSLVWKGYDVGRLCGSIMLSLKLLVIL